MGMPVGRNERKENAMSNENVVIYAVLAITDESGECFYGLKEYINA